MILSIFVFLFVLSVLVFVHELGHFMVAKLMKMRVDEFAIGFPPRIYARQYGDTTYAINSIPMGGYVKIHGENPEQADKDPGSFQQKPVWARIAVIVAGVSMNLLFAFVVLSVAYSVGFISVSQNLADVPGAVVKDSQVYITQILPGSTAEHAALKPGDRVVSFTDPVTNAVTPVSSIGQMQAFTKSRQGNQPDLKINVERNGAPYASSVTLAPGGPALGVGLDALDTVRIPFWRAPGAALHEIGFIMKTTWDALKQFAGKLFIHGQLDKTISGPVGIYQASAAAAHQGFISVIFLMVVLSINLALLNILPIPALDGGKLFFLLTELVFRRRVIAERVENLVGVIGFSLLIILIVIVSIKDIIHLF
jgi:regulator of sigma E protease